MQLANSFVNFPQIVPNVYLSCIGNVVAFYKDENVLEVEWSRVEDGYRIHYHAFKDNNLLCEGQSDPLPLSKIIGVLSVLANDFFGAIK